MEPGIQNYYDSYGYYCYHIPITDNQGKVIVISVGATSTFFFFFER